MCNFTQRISSVQEFQFGLETCAGGEVTQESSSNPGNLQLPSFKVLKNEIWVKNQNMIQLSLNKLLFEESINVSKNDL